MSTRRAVMMQLKSHLSVVLDHWQAQDWVYDLGHLLLFSVLTVATGATSYRKTQRFIEAHRERLHELCQPRWKPIESGPIDSLNLAEIAMNLDEFVKEVLSQIISGICNAQKAEGGAFIAPAADRGHDYAKHPRVSSNKRIKSTIVDFDVALTVDDSNKGSGDGGLKVLGIGEKIQGELSSKDTTVSRIQFAVPILLPESWRVRYEESKDKRE